MTNKKKMAPNSVYVVVVGFWRLELGHGMDKANQAKPRRDLPTGMTP